MKVALAGVAGAELRALTRVLQAVPATLAWVATGPASLLERLRLDPPEVLVASAHGTFDVFRALGGSTKERGFAIVLVVDDPRARVHEVYAAMERGASDVARMPSLRADGTLDDAGRLTSKLARFVTPSPTENPGHHFSPPVVVLAASTGGPAALGTVLAGVTPGLTARSFLVQHIDDVFTAGLADWLAARSGREVALADDGAILDTRTVLVARADAQPTLDAGGRVRYRAFTPDEIYRPSIDAFFQSCLRLPRPGVAALLTGMGEDGARGLLALRLAGWTTIAQDEQTSAVFGMPAKAAALGAATHVLPLTDIGPSVSRAAATLGRVST